MQVKRLNGNPIIRPHMDDAMGDNINGPSLIRVPDWIKNPLGRYYLYFGHHQGQYIRMAYADALEGPWITYQPGKGVLHLNDTRFRNHIASPDVIVDQRAKQLRMYFHGPASQAQVDEASHLLTEFHLTYKQLTTCAVSDDGLSFHEPPGAEIVGSSYFRAFDWDGYTYAVDMPMVFYRSRNPIAGFERGPSLMDNSIRHSAVRRVDSTLQVFFSRAGAAPEHIERVTIDLAGDWMRWRASEPVSVIKPERDWEGADLPVEPSRRGWAKERKHQLRDPAIFTEDGSTYLLYSVAGEHGIAIAELVE